MYRNSLLKLGRDHRGDTIVEVMLAIAIIGAVLGAAYVATNNNARTNRASQDRLIATKVAEGQLERLRAMATVADTQDAVFSEGGSFCIHPLQPILEPAGDPLCRVNSSSINTTDQPYFDITITPGSTIGTPVYSGKLFTISVEWDSVVNESRDTVTYQYGLYR